MSKSLPRIDTFALEPGRRIAGKYIVGDRLGTGWEGEVYHVTEIATGIERAAKIFFPQRNPGNKSMLFYAKKLDDLRRCSIVIQYHTQEMFKYRGQPIPLLVSEFVEGQLLSELIHAQRGKRMHPFEALHLVHALTCGVEEIHRAGEYHGDLHTENIIVRRKGLGFDMKVIDFYSWGRCTPHHILDDVCSIVRILYDAVGGPKHYANQPPVIKHLCKGLKRTLIKKEFKTATQLRERLESLEL